MKFYRFSKISKLLLELSLAQSLIMIKSE